MNKNIGYIHASTFCHLSERVGHVWDEYGRSEFSSRAKKEKRSRWESIASEKE